MAKRKSYRYRGRRSWRRYKKYNYFTAKVEFDGDLVFPQTTAGQPNFSTTAASYMSIGTILSANDDFKKYTALFQMYRVKGIKLDFAPTCGNSSLSSITHTKPVYVGWNITGTNAEVIQLLKYSDKAIMLNPLEKSAKYWSMWGYQDDWKLSQSQLGGYIACYTEENATDNTGPAWSYRITFYIAFKSTK